MQQTVYYELYPNVVVKLSAGAFYAENIFMKVGNHCSRYPVDIKQECR